MEYLFTLKYQLTEHDSDFDALVERLGENGCDDALAGIGQPGRLALEFTRAAKSAEVAVRSALAAVKRAVPHARLTEMAPDFVGLTDVAETIGTSRQNMRKLMLAHATTFPSPIHEGSASVWHLAEILEWLEGRGGYAVERRTLEISKVALQVNLAKEAHWLTAKSARELVALVTS